MDGVVADWVEGAAKIVGYHLNDPTDRFPEDDWKKIKVHQRLFKDLPLLPHAEVMVNVARQFRDELGWELVFLTAIPHNNDMHYSFWDKTLWGQTRFPDIPVHFGPYSKDKHLHCKPGDVLVDDRPDNCEQWRNAGGIAVHVKYDHYNKAIYDLKDVLEKKLSFQRLRDY